MSEPARPLTGRSLLGVFAHPDDESLACGGLLARCTALGARVSLLCATHGEWGNAASSGAGRRDAAGLGGTRRRELEAAARVLGVADVTILDHEDGMLPWVDAAVLEADIRDAIHRHRPDVVVTFAEDGLYWHPDHIALHERTTAAVAALGPEAPALYYVTMPQGRMRAVVQCVAAQGDEAAPTSVLGIADVDAFGALAAAPTLVVEAGAFAVQKLAALRCHRSQVEGDPLDRLTDADAVRLLGTEHFRRASAGAAGRTFIEEFAEACTAAADAAPQAAGRTPHP